MSRRLAILLVGMTMAVLMVAVAGMAWATTERPPTGPFRETPHKCPGDDAGVSNPPPRGFGSGPCPSPSDDPGLIVYASPHNTPGSDIYAISADGTGGPKRLTDDPANDDAPALSPDGSKIAWHRSGEIWKMRSDGSGKARLTKPAPSLEKFAWNPSWSPDGRHIAFDRDGDIWVMKSNGKGARRVTNDPSIDRQPAWSPNGSRIAFQRSEFLGDGAYSWNEIFVVKRSGTGARKVTHSPYGEDAWFPDWSPDGSEIAFSRFGFHQDGFPQSQIYAVAPNGTGERRILGYDPNETGSYEDSAFSPDGSKIVAGGDLLVVADRDGTELGALRSGTQVVGGSRPDWGPKPPRACPANEFCFGRAPH